VARESPVQVVEAPNVGVIDPEFGLAACPRKIEEAEIKTPRAIQAKMIQKVRVGSRCCFFIRLLAKKGFTSSAAVGWKTRF
jgi:hypothetical protein